MAAAAAAVGGPFVFMLFKGFGGAGMTSNTARSGNNAVPASKEFPIQDGGDDERKWIFIEQSGLTAVPHPSTIINKILLDLYPSARVAVMTDAAWQDILPRNWKLMTINSFIDQLQVIKDAVLVGEVVYLDPLNESTAPQSYLYGLGGPPDPWRICTHPNGDQYYYHPEWRLLTTDDILDATTLGYIADSRDDIVQHLETLNLPSDYELVIVDTSDITAKIKIYSRSAGRAYKWSDENELLIEPAVEFWTLVAEFPSHHPDLPPNTEVQFASALEKARTVIANGGDLGFTLSQIDLITVRFNALKALQLQGQSTTAPLAWLMGMVLPLDEGGGKRVDGRNLEAMMNELHI